MMFKSRYAKSFAEKVADHRFRNLALLILGIAGLAGCRDDSSYPHQPITLICPWAAGGGTDRVSRQVASQLEQELGVPVNVINATGGSGVTGHTRGAWARPDGYTITMLTVELNMLHWRGLTDVTYRDFSPLILLNRDNAALFVREDSPYRHLDDLEAAIRTRPGELKASGTAQGGIWHVAMAGWMMSRSLKIEDATWISINGAGPSLQELVAGGVDFVCCSLPEADAMLAGGQVRCLGVMAEERVPGFESVSTFLEQGHDWSIAGWRGIAAPLETPQQRVDLLAEALRQVVRSEEFRTFMNNAGFNLSIEDSEAFASTLAQQDELFREILTGDSFRPVSDEHFGPLLFPAVVGVLLLIVLPLVIRDVRQERERESAEQISIGEDVRERRRLTSWLMPLAVLFAVGFYLLAAEWLGFLLTSVLMLSGLLSLFRVRLWVALAVAVTVGMTAYQVFAVLLRVPLPRGFLGW